MAELREMQPLTGEGQERVRTARMVRTAAGQKGRNMPIFIDHSAGGKRRAPRVEGASFYWTTPGGKPISHPSAYRWEKVYHPSTLRIVVGADWVRRRMTAGK